MKTGPLFEKQVAEYLAGHGWPQAERRVMGGINDKGDIAGIPGWTLECKAERRLDLATALKEAEQEAANAGTGNFAAIIKRRQHPIADSYVVMPLHQFVDMDLDW